MAAAPFRRGTSGRGAATAARPVVPSRPSAPLRRPEPNLRRPEGLVRQPTLAMSLGSSSAGAVLVTTERETVIDDPDLGQPIWPASVAHDGVAPRVGGAAENFSRIHPLRYRGRLKQLLGEPGVLPLGERSFAAVELVSWLLAAMRDRAGKLGDVEVERAVITVPTSFRPGDLRRATLLEAAALAGFGTVELLAEPLATIAAPVVGGAFSPGDMVLVCDFGAGGFCSALASVLQTGEVELLGSREDLGCSGAEIDRLVTAELLTRAGRSWSELTHPSEDPAARVRTARARRVLADRAQSIKHQLSSRDSATELIGPDEVPVELTAAELTALTGPLVHRALAGAREMVLDSGVRTGELAGVLLSGGCSRMPVVSDLVGETFGRPVRTSVDLRRAVVEGAARFARSVDRRHVRARIATERETPLRWELPGGEGHDLHWLMEPGSRFGAGDPMASVRLADGSLWELRAGRTGTLLRTHLPTGSTAVSGDWLVTVELDVRTFR